MSKNPRLRFSDEELHDPALEKPIRKVNEAVKKADKAQAKIPKKVVKVNEYAADPRTGKITTRLVFEDKRKPPSKLSHSVKSMPVSELKSQIHKEIRKSEEDNVGVESAHKLEEAAESGGRFLQNSYRSHKLKPYRKASTAEKRLEKANISALQKSAMRDDPTFSSNPLSRWQQKRAIRKQYAAAKSAGQTTYKTGQAAKTAKKAAENTEKTTQFISRHRKGIAVIVLASMLLMCIMGGLSSCTMLFEAGLSGIAMSTYPSEDSDMLAVEAAYAAKEFALQTKLNNYESSNPGYDEYVYELDIIGHDPHELAAYLSALYQEYTLSEVQSELQRVFDLQYTLTETVTIETRYRVETVTDPETGETSTENVAYEYSIMTVTLTNNWLSHIVTASLNAEQLNFFGLYRATLGNKPLLFGGGSNDSAPSVDLSGVVFVNGERKGNQSIVDIALAQMGNAGGYTYWSWYGWQSRVAWCACFVSWCINQAGKSEPYFAYCPYGANWYSQHGQWARRGYEHIAPGDVIFFDWESDGITDHVGIVIGTDGTYVYTVEGNSGDAVRVKSYLLDSSVIYGYGLMNW